MIKLPSNEVFSLKGLEILLITNNGAMEHSEMRIILQKTNSNICFCTKNQLPDFESKCYDVAFLDVSYLWQEDVACILNKTLGEMPTIAFSSDRSRAHEAFCIANGVTEYLDLPVSEENIYNAVLRHVGKAKLELFAKTFQGKPLYDTLKLRELSRGNEEFVRSMLELFLETTPDNMRKIKSAYEHNDLPGLKMIAHTMKPSLDMLNIKSLDPTVRNIEEHALKIKDAVALHLEICHLLRVLDEVMADLKRVA